jgi:hypothetical protein
MMPTSRAVHPFEPSGRRRDLVQLIRQIQALTLELTQLRQRLEAHPEIGATERTLEQLHWRLATVARRTATDDLGAAA